MFLRLTYLFNSKYFDNFWICSSVQTFNSVPFSRLSRYSLSSIRVPSESNHSSAVSISFHYQPHWPDEKGDLCLSRQWEFFQHDFYHNKLTKNT